MPAKLPYNNYAQRQNHKQVHEYGQTAHWDRTLFRAFVSPNEPSAIHAFSMRYTVGVGKGGGGHSCIIPSASVNLEKRRCLVTKNRTKNYLYTRERSQLMLGWTFFLGEGKKVLKFSKNCRAYFHFGGIFERTFSFQEEAGKNVKNRRVWRTLTTKCGCVFETFHL